MGSARKGMKHLVEMTNEFSKIEMMNVTNNHKNDRYMQKPALAFIGFVFCFLFLSCEKSDSGCGHSNNYIVVNKVLDYDIISTYTGRDKLTFVNTSTQQKVVFQSYGIDTSFKLENVADVDEECPRYEKYESRSIHFWSEDSLDNIYINLYRDPHSFSVISMRFKQHYFDERTYLFSRHHYDSVAIQNKVFHKIRLVNKYGSAKREDLEHLYYNLSHGIIRFRLRSGEVWELLEKE